jgi:hypothetical protein
MDLDGSVECQKPRLGDGWNLGGILHLEEDVPGALAVVVREIDRLGLQVGQDGLDRRAELAGFRRRVPQLDRDSDFQ